MPTGRFNTKHKTFFNAIDGAYTAMSAEEVRKESFNVKAVIRDMAIDNKLGPAIDRNIWDCDFTISDKISGFTIPSVNLRFRYSKEDREEMSIYFNASRGIPQNKLVADNIWFIYIKAGDSTPWLGIMTPAEWATVTSVTTVAAPVVPVTAPVTTTRHRILKKVLSYDDKRAEKESDQAFFDEINDSEILETATFEYSGVPKEKQAPSISGGREVHKRDKQVSLNALTKATNKCEVDALHPSFMRKNKSVPYMEPHHLIPLAYQDEYVNSLDIEENIVSLCSNCHNRFHYGWGFERILKKLYDERIDHLRRAGIDISFDDLLEIYS